MKGDNKHVLEVCTYLEKRETKGFDDILDELNKIYWMS